MIVITGGSGLIGSNLLKKLNKENINNIIIVDDLSDGKKFINIKDNKFADYMDKDDFILSVMDKKFLKNITAIYHLGACTNTKEWNGKFLLKNNFEYSKIIFENCIESKTPFFYASSASVYGTGKQGFREEPQCENPINMYAFSKLIFDNYIRRNLTRCKFPVVGLRYFNVFGMGEFHKNDMGSVILKFYKEILELGKCRLFKESDGFKKGEQKRDYISATDCAEANYLLLEKPPQNGIYNFGTGKAKSFNEIAKTVLDWFLEKDSKKAKIEYIDFPADLIGSYQSFTEADMSKFNSEFLNFTPIETQTAIYDYLDEIRKKS